MAAPDPNAWSTGGDRYPEDEAHELIEKCIQLFMNREETAHTLEIHFGIDCQFTLLVWDKLEEDNPEYFQNYYTRLALKQQIVRFNESLEQQYRTMNFPLMPVEQQMSMELAETALQGDSPVSITNNENEARFDKLPANPVGSVKSEEVAGSDPNLVPGGGLVSSSLEGQGMSINADAAHKPISQVSNLITGGHRTAKLRGPFPPSSKRARSLSHLDSNPEGSDQKDLTNSASGQGSPSADL